MLKNVGHLFLLLALANCSNFGDKPTGLGPYKACVTCNYKFTDFKNRDLSHSNLKGSYFFGAIFSDAKLMHSDLQATNFVHALMSGVNASHSNITSIQANFAGLMYADFSYTKGKFSNFNNGDLNYASLKGANLVLPSFAHIEGLDTVS